MNIRKEYESGRSLQDLANELGVAKSTVGEFLKLQGVKMRPRGRPPKLEVARDRGPLKHEKVKRHCLHERARAGDRRDVPDRPDPWRVNRR